MAARTKLIACQMIGICILLGFGAWLFVSFGGVSTQITCFLDKIDVLKAVKGQVSTKAASIMKQIPSSITDLVRTFLPLVAALVVTPAALIAAIQLLTVCCSANPCKNSRVDEICAKVLIFLLQIRVIQNLRSSFVPAYL